MTRPFGFNRNASFCVMWYNKFAIFTYHIATNVTNVFCPTRIIYGLATSVILGIRGCCFFSTIVARFPRLHLLPLNRKVEILQDKVFGPGHKFIAHCGILRRFRGGLIMKVNINFNFLFLVFVFTIIEIKTKNGFPLFLFFYSQQVLHTNNNRKFHMA